MIGIHLDVVCISFLCNFVRVPSVPGAGIHGRNGDRPRPEKRETRRQPPGDPTGTRSSPRFLSTLCSHYTSSWFIWNSSVGVHSRRRVSRTDQSCALELKVPDHLGLVGFTCLLNVLTPYIHLLFSSSIFIELDVLIFYQRNKLVFKWVD